MMCAMEELIPSIGTSVPSPSVLAVVISHSDSTIQNISKLYSDGHPSLYADTDNPFDSCDESLVISKTPLISISDDGILWKWLLTAEGSGDVQNKTKKLCTAAGIGTTLGNHQMDFVPSNSAEINMYTQPNYVHSSRSCLLSAAKNDEVSFKVCV